MSSVKSNPRSPNSQWTRYTVPHDLNIIPHHDSPEQINPVYLKGFVDGLQIAWEAAKSSPVVEGEQVPKDYFMALSNVQSILVRARQILEDINRGEGTSE